MITQQPSISKRKMIQEVRWDEGIMAAKTISPVGHVLLRYGRIAFHPLFLFTLAIANSEPAQALVLCVPKTGKPVVVVRKSCPRNERPLDPTLVGLQGPSGALGLQGPTEGNVRHDPADSSALGKKGLVVYPCALGTFPTPERTGSSDGRSQGKRADERRFSRKSASANQ